MSAIYMLLYAQRITSELFTLSEKVYIVSEGKWLGDGRVPLLSIPYYESRREHFMRRMFCVIRSHRYKELSFIIIKSLKVCQVLALSSTQYQTLQKNTQ